MAVTADRTHLATAARIAEGVRAGAVQPRAVVAEALEAIARHDDVLCAFEAVRPQSLDEADRVADSVREGAEPLPLAGVPIAVKDLVPVAGEVMRCGSRATDREPATDDHPVVARLRAAGAVVVGTTTTPEAGLWLTTDGDRITRNPWQLTVSASGSSGGSAAAVASGVVPVAHGTDGLGSVRQPAAACGVLGMKPTRGLVPARLGANDWYGLAENGPIARTTTDLALLLSVMAGDPALAEVRRLRRRLRIAVSARPPVQGVRTSPAITRGLFSVAGVLQAAGHRVERDQPSYPSRLSLAGTMRWLASAADFMDAAADPSELQARTVGHAGAGRRVRSLIRAEQLAEWRTRAATFFESYDVMLTPVTAAPPLRAERWSERSWAANLRANVATSGGFCGMWNVAGFPAISVPVGMDEETGVPLAVQIAAPAHQDGLLLSLAAELEALRPWTPVAPGWD